MSTVPLIDSDGKPVPLPRPGSLGYGLRLNDQQTVMISNFNVRGGHEVDSRRSWSWKFPNIAMVDQWKIGCKWA